MGFLSGIGTQLAQGMGGLNAASAAQQSLGWGTFGTGASAAGALLEGIGGLQQAQFASKVSGEAAGAARVAGQQEESASRMKYGGLEAEQKVAQAANGIEVGSGSAEAVRAATQGFSDMDAALIHYNAAREAYGLREQASIDRKVGDLSLLRGVSKASNTLLAGASSLSDKWQMYRQSGALGA